MVPERLAERGLLGDGLGPGVDHLVAYTRVVGPRGDKAPMQHLKLPLAILDENCGYPLGGGDVVAGCYGRRRIVYLEALRLGIYGRP